MVYTEADIQLNESEQTVSFQDAVVTVISVLKEEGADAYERREGEGHFWTFKYGTVDVYVHLTGETSEDSLTVWSPVLDLPSRDDLALAKDLLHKNWQETSEARFALWNNRVVIEYVRSLADTSPSDISRAITVVATLADDYDEPLIETYGT
ncbi:MAG: YbjN domain-containing protein [Synechococcus sp.]